MTARRPTKRNNTLYTRNQILQNAIQPPDVNIEDTNTATSMTSDNANDDIRTSIITLLKAVSDLKDHLTSVSDTVKSLKEQSDHSLEKQQHITVQADIMDQPLIHQTGTTATITEQTQNDNSNGIISRIGTNNSNYDSPSYLENVTFTQTTCNNTFQSALPVGATVSDDIKGKIWANEYINFDILLPEDGMVDKPIPLSVERDNQNRPRLVFNENTDTVEQEARLPSDKLSKCIELIQEFLRRKKVTLREIQSLCGLLNFACQVVLPGRAFLRRLYEITKTLRKPQHTVKLTRGCKDDLLVWKSFLEHFNGKCFFIDERMVSNDVFQLYTDASGTYGYGAVFGKSWFYGE
ncbi:unnamed protein product [Mytilus coruscus]|uniref:Uncharacterized protein n=1 Tax=Mytilus coruscus TaxID=42192 RepID=A0A6J8E6B8_MYTCO|nr:unnamed protein product [Mytilus coruscus]